MKEISLINHSRGALGLRFLGLGPNLKPTNGLSKLKRLLDRKRDDDKLDIIENRLSIYENEVNFKNMRKLTFEGENAEAYWSFDDSKLIFQATN